MEKITTEAEYQEALAQIETLLLELDGKLSFDDPRFVRMDGLSEQVALYEDTHYPIGIPKLIDVIKLRMYEMGLKQKDLADKLGVPTSRVSEYLRGKRDFTLDVARKLHSQLNIDGDIILQ